MNITLCLFVINHNNNLTLDLHQPFVVVEFTSTMKLLPIPPNTSNLYLSTEAVGIIRKARRYRGTAPGETIFH